MQPVLENYKTKDIHLIIRKSLRSEVLSATDDGKAEKIARGIAAANPSSLITWDTTLKADEKKKITYRYKDSRQTLGFGGGQQKRLNGSRHHSQSNSMRVLASTFRPTQVMMVLSFDTSGSLFLMGCLSPLIPAFLKAWKSLQGLLCGK